MLVTLQDGEAAACLCCLKGMVDNTKITEYQRQCIQGAMQAIVKAKLASLQQDQEACQQDFSA